MSVSPDDTIEDVTQKIYIKEGINPDQQILFFNGKKLDSSDTYTTLNDYHITFSPNNDKKSSIPTTTLFLTIRNLGG